MNSHDLTTKLAPTTCTWRSSSSTHSNSKSSTAVTANNGPAPSPPTGVFQAADMPDPLVGRDILTQAITRQSLMHEGLILRHWVGQLTVEQLDDNTLRAQSYVMVYVVPNQTLLDGDVHFRHHTLCDDELIRTNDSWLVRTRYVQTDGAYKSTKR
ncbi:nuclear transport factor 2 family protein [Kitasatospora cinereorecta]